MKSKSLVLSLSAAATLGLNSQSFANNPDALKTEKLDQGYGNTQQMTLADANADDESSNQADSDNESTGESKPSEGKCGNGKCGAGKCGEGSCGG